MAGIIAATSKEVFEIHQMARGTVPEEWPHSEPKEVCMSPRFHLLLSLGALALVACGKQEAPAAPTPAPAAATAPAPAPAPVAVNEAGKSAFGKACALCHAAGVGGAPKPGDKADWGPRIAQGNEVLYKHALEGFTGGKGTMPPKGGSTLADADVKAAVDYMVGQSK